MLIGQNCNLYRKALFYKAFLHFRSKFFDQLFFATFFGFKGLEPSNSSHTTSLKVELEKEKSEREQNIAAEAENNPDNVAEQKEVPEQERPQKSRSDIVADELMGAPVQKEVKLQGNPDMARTENTETVSSETLSYVETNHLSEPSSKDIRNPTDRNEGRSDKSGKKPSVRAELNKLKKAREKRIKNESKHRHKAPIKNNKPKVK